MKLLIILIWNFPYPLKSGGQQAVHHITDRLRHVMDITILSVVHTKKDLRDVEKLKREWKNVTFIEYHKYEQSRIIDRIKETVSKTAAFLFRKSHVAAINEELYKSACIDPGFVDFTCKVLESSHYDIIQTEFFEALPYVYSFPDHVKKVFVQHEIRYIRNERLSASETSLSYYGKFLINQTKNDEIAAMNRYDAVIALTETDKNILTNSGVSVPVYTSPAIIACPSDAYRAEYGFDNRIVFLGGYEHTPNFLGVKWFLDNIWNKILDDNREVSFFIVGQWPEKVMKDMSKRYKSVFFSGYVPDLSVVFKDSIMVVPLQIGSGMRMKIVDAANHGCPIVTTSVGAEGLTLQNEYDCIIEDAPDLFAKKLALLMRDNDKLLFLRKNAKNKMEKLYSPEALFAKRFSIYQEL
jgi:glycosyltransferase involved in cell wall biosynthesis